MVSKRKLLPKPLLGGLPLCRKDKLGSKPFSICEFLWLQMLIAPLCGDGCFDAPSVWATV